MKKRSIIDKSYLKVAIILIFSVALFSVYSENAKADWDDFWEDVLDIFV